MFLMPQLAISKLLFLSLLYVQVAFSKKLTMYLLRQDDVARAGKLIYHM
jgi:hypothetical protein